MEQETWSLSLLQRYFFVSRQANNWIIFFVIRRELLLLHLNLEIMSIAEFYELFLRHPHISTDTRHLVKDSMFFALKGASFDGNQSKLLKLAVLTLWSTMLK